MEISSSQWSRLIIEGAARWGVKLGPDQIALFVRHGRELLKWNAVTNLTSITDPKAIACRHFLDSLAPASLIASGSELLDVGSGGGFPGLPLHIVIPGLRTTLLDAARKKVSFLRHVLRELGLVRIQALQARAEELALQREHAGRYDVIVSRAFAALSPFVEAALPLLKPGGRMIVWKGASSMAELEDLRRAAGVGLALDCKQYTLPGMKSGRILVIVTRSAPAA